MTKLPQIKAKEIIKVLKKRGFILYHQVGNHATFKRSSDNRRVTIPIHPGKTIAKGTLLNILKQAGISQEELKKLLK